MKPIVFLDVDGVINDLAALDFAIDEFGGSKDWTNRNKPIRLDMGAYEVTGTVAGRYRVFIPDYMPALVQSLVATSDVYWLTTWRDRANKYISPLLDIPSNLPVITDGSNSRNVGWKAQAAKATVAGLATGRDIFWIEDFGKFEALRVGATLGDTVKLIDTDREGRLRAEDLPASWAFAETS